MVLQSYYIEVYTKNLTLQSVNQIIRFLPFDHLRGYVTTVSLSFHHPSTCMPEDVQIKDTTQQ